MLKAERPHFRLTCACVAEESVFLGSPILLVLPSKKERLASPEQSHSATRHYFDPASFAAFKMANKIRASGKLTLLTCPILSRLG